MVHLTRVQKTHVIVHNAAVAAGGIGAGWLNDLVLVPDIYPLCTLQAIMLVLIARVFGIRWLQAVLGALLGAFSAGVAGRGLATLLFLRLPEHEIFVYMGCAVVFTEILGWVAYRVCRTTAREQGLAPAVPEVDLHAPVPHVEPSFMTTVLRASRRGHWRVLLISAPMVLAALGAFIVPSVQHYVNVRARAPGGPGSTSPLLIAHPLIERHQGALWISGEPRGRHERVRLVVRNDVLADGLERSVLLYQPPPLVRVLAWVPAGALPPPGAGQGPSGPSGSSRPPGPNGPPPVISVDPGWEVAVDRVSDYWQQVRERLYLLLIGLVGTAAMVLLGERRGRRGGGISPSRLSRSGAALFTSTSSRPPPAP